MSLDPAEFRAVADRVLASISTAQEIETHGTPQQRLAAIDRGLDGGRPQSCQLASFH
jgi:predicted metalloprotease